MAKYIPATIKIRGKVCYLASKKAMKALYDADVHHGTFVMYNDEYYVKPNKLSEKALTILKEHSVYLG